MTLPSSELLRSLRPSLITRIDWKSDMIAKSTSYIAQDVCETDEVIDEGYDPIHSPLGCPVYWRIVKRGAEKLYLSTFLVTRQQVKRIWGDAGLHYCDPATGRLLRKSRLTLVRVTQSYVKALDERILLRLARRGVRLLDPCLRQAPSVALP